MLLRIFCLILIMTDQTGRKIFETKELNIHRKKMTFPKSFGKLVTGAATKDVECGTPVPHSTISCR